MKHLVSVILFITISHIASAQIYVSNGAAGMITDINGSPILSNPNSNVNGSPFYIPEWSDAEVVLSNGKELKNVPIKLNLLTQEIHYQLLDKKKSEMIASKGAIKSVVFGARTENKLVQYKFVNGFAPNDGLTVNHFYLVLAEGKVSFLKSISKSIVEHKPFNSAVVERNVETKIGLYFNSGSTMKLVKKNKDFMLNQFADKKESVEEYISTHKLKCKTEDEIIQLVNFYNSLN